MLKPDGTFWLNIGNTYSSGGRKWRDADDKNKGRAMSYRPPTPPGLKKKDLIGVAWLLALECQKDGWYLRNDIIWHKPNCQPESVKDRFTVSHEYLFMFSKSERYYFDQEAIKENTANGNGRKNRRTIWSINTEPCPEAHFAVFPRALIRPCIVAGSRKDDMILDPFYGAGTVGIVTKELGATVCRYRTEIVSIWTSPSEGRQWCKRPFDNLQTCYTASCRVGQGPHSPLPSQNRACDFHRTPAQAGC